MRFHTRQARALAVAFPLAVLVVPAALQADLVHHWPFDETSGLTAQDAAGGATGELVGFENNDDSQWVEGQFHGALHLGADFTFDNYVRVNLQAIDASATGGFTVMMWINPGNAILNPGEYQLLSTPGDVIGFTIMNATVDGTHHDRVLLFWDGNLQTLHVGTTTLEPGTWYHVAITSTGIGGEKNYYINGELEEKVLFMPSQGGTQGVDPANRNGWGAGAGQIGGINGANRTHDSIIDDVRIYDTALTAEEIQDILANPPPLLPRITLLTPQPGDNFHDPAAGVQFEVSTDEPGATLPVSGIKLFLNGTDVSDALAIGGTDTLREVEYSGLDPGTTYNALIEVTDSKGSTSRLTFVFATLAPPEDPDLLHHFKFDETSGFVAIDSAGGSNATLFNFETDGESHWVPGIIDGALDFGADDTPNNYAQFEIEAVDSFVTGGFTIAMWVKPGPAINTPGEYQLLATPGDQIGFTIMNTTRGGRRHDRVLLFWDGSLPDLHVGTTALEPGNWYHVAITSTGPGGEKLYYVNGRLEEQRLFDPNAGGVEGMHIATRAGWPAGTAEIGGINGANRTHDSVIDDLRIYSIPLEEADIADIMGQPPPEPLVISDVVPADGVLFHDAASGLSFVIETPNPGAEIPPGNISLVLDGTDVSGDLVISGTPVRREVSYSGLEPGRMYQALISARDTRGGGAELALTFGTFTRTEPGLRHHYKMDETSGLTAADSVLGADGTLFNFELNDDSQWVRGKIDGALDLGADPTNNNYVQMELPAMNAEETGGFTVAMWVKPSEAILAPGEYQLFSTPGDSIGFTIMNTTIGDRVHDRVLLFWDGDITTLHVGTTTLEPGEWYHVAITSTGAGGEKKYYVNGIEDEQRLFDPSRGGVEGEHPASRNGWPSGIARIGAVVGLGAGRTHGSVIDDVRIYDVALTAEEIQALVPEEVIQFSNLSPPEGELFHDAALGLQFDVSTSAAGASIEPDGIRVVLNGVDVSADLEIGGTPSQREVAYNALEADTLYEVFIEVTDTSGATATKEFVFGTLVRSEEPGLRHHFRLDERRGLRAADSAAGILGSLQNFENDDDSQWVAGQVGGALNLGADETNNNFVQATIPAMNALETGGFTVAMWIKPRDAILNPGEYQLFNAPGNNVGFTIFNGVVDDITHDRVLLFWDGNLPDLHVGTTPLEPGQWYHVAITSTGIGGEKKYYLNGVEEEQRLFAPSQGGQEGFHPGSSDGWPDGLATFGALPNAARAHGSVSDDIRIYETALSPEDIALLAEVQPPGVLFVRGDADSNGTIQLTDAIRILGFLFQGAAALQCDDAGDADDNGELQITDGIRILQWLFTGGAPPAPPRPSAAEYAAGDCGTDPTEDALDCAEVSAKCEA